MMRTSELLARALKLQPTGQAHTGPDCLCGFCGVLIRPGDISASLDFPASFVDFHKLVPSSHVCGHCKTMISASEDGEVLLKNIQRAVITSEGVFSLSTDAARAWLWLSPPKPPFAVVINHSVLAAFHYPWRTPVTLHSDYIQINVDDKVMDVNRLHVLKALKMSEYLLEEFNRGALKSKRHSPFIVLLREPQSGHGQLAEEILRFVRTSGNPQLDECVSFLSQLGRGELFALSSLLKKDKVTSPEKPACLKGLSQIGVMKLSARVEKLRADAEALRSLVIARAAGEPCAPLGARRKSLMADVQKLQQEKQKWQPTLAKDLLAMRNQFVRELDRTSALLQSIN